MAPLVSITDTLAVKPVDGVNGFEAFKSTRLWTPAGARGVFGGQVIAQSLQAASKTVVGKELHSQHVSDAEGAERSEAALPCAE